MGKVKLFILAILVAIIAFGIWVFTQVRPSLPNKPTLYVTQNCPHCQNVKTYIQKNQVHTQFDFDEKQLNAHSRDIRELVRVMRFCGYQTNQLPIPVLWTGNTQKCIVGEKNIISFFDKKSTHTTIVPEKKMKITPVSSTQKK